uniref:Lipoprotein signal peptidase n=1 Tax=uncultured Desulfobacterium sp. TaxID=201089 RepID=E1YJD5_9BACT|nr:Lipoprotein signal peptidase [uncultured Desulfobacterium sp.]
MRFAEIGKKSEVRLFENKYLKLIFIAGIVILLDQATKIIVLKYMPLYHSISIIPGFFNLTHIHNPGGAFGFLAGQSPFVRKLAFIVVSFLALCFILYFYRVTPRKYPMLATALALIFGGAAGNLVDRIRFGKVVDFLDIYIRNLHWPAFNIADSAISIGMCILLFHILLKK